MPSVGFITEQSVAGAISTGTHGSGRHSLSHYVQSIRVARYDRQTGNAVVEEIETGDALLAARCSLGCLGVILSVTMSCRPRYRVEEHFAEYDNLGEVIDAEDVYPICVRKILPDDTLISMACDAGSSSSSESNEATAEPTNLTWYSITLTNYHRGSNRKPFEDFASFLAKSMAKLFQARPHWGKLCPLSPEELRGLYPAMDRFRKTVADADPEGAFGNDWTQSLFVCVSRSKDA